INTGDDSATQQTSVSRQADLAITNVDSPDPVSPGATLTYTITVTNSGPSDVTGVTVSDNFPASLSNLNLTNVATTGAATSPPTAAARSPPPTAPFPIPFSHPTTLPANTTLTYTITATVGTGAAGTTISDTASISSPSDTTPGNNSSTATTTVNGVDLTVS